MESELETAIQQSKIIPLESVLQDEQSYVSQHLAMYGGNMSAVKHSKPTTTCFEKADLIGFEPEQVIKSIMLWNKKGQFYAFVAPEIGAQGKPLRFDQETMKKLFGDDKKTYKSLQGLTNKFSKDHYIQPEIGMDRGTCTPFVPDYYFQGDGWSGSLEKIYVLDHPAIDDKIVDLSIGGIGDEARKISVQTTYKTMYDIINKQFPGKVEKMYLK